VTTERHRAGAVPLQPDELQRLLRRQLRRGLRASRLLDCPELVEFLSPERDDPGQVLFDRALTAEAKIAQAIERIGGRQAQALRILCGFDDGTVGLSLQERRKLAGSAVSRPRQHVSCPTFVKNYEPGLVLDLAVEVWRSRTVAG
jgi:hypothetical protein